MLIVGITGGIGSGKTTVCKIFEVLGIPVYYADQRAQEILVHNKNVVDKVKQLLGEEAYVNEALNKSYIAARVFSNPALLAQYNAIVHPVVAEDTLHWTSQYANKPYVLKEAALLIESGAHRMLDKLILVSAPLELRIQRVMQRDQTDRETVMRRIQHQMSEEEKRKYADFLIVNDGSTSIISQVLDIHHQLLHIALGR